MIETTFPDNMVNPSDATALKAIIVGIFLFLRNFLNVQEGQ